MCANSPTSGLFLYILCKAVLPFISSHTIPFKPQALNQECWPQPARGFCPMVLCSPLKSLSSPAEAPPGMPLHVFGWGNRVQKASTDFLPCISQQPCRLGRAHVVTQILSLKNPKPEKLSDFPEVTNGSIRNFEVRKSQVQVSALPASWSGITELC